MYQFGKFQRHFEDKWLPHEIEAVRRTCVLRPEFQDEVPDCLDAPQLIPAGSRFVNGGHYCLTLCDRDTRW